MNRLINFVAVGCALYFVGRTFQATFMGAEPLAESSAFVLALVVLSYAIETAYYHWND